MILRAKYVLDRNFQTIDNGFLRVESSRVVEVGTGKETSAGEFIDCGDALLMPGLVNAHTHLELGSLHGAVTPTHNFVEWLTRLVPKMRQMATNPKQIQESVRSGLATSLVSGTTQLADISRFAPITREAIFNIDSRPAVISFGEVLGAEDVTADKLLIQSVGRSHESDTLSLGISPHSAYSVSHFTMLKCVVAIAALRARMCIHAAESMEEEEFLVNGSGPLRDFLESVGACDSSYEPFGARPIEYLNRVGALGPLTLLAHCNYINDDEINLIACKKTSAVYCPRTHHAFGHPPHRFIDMLDAGINVCLGTDSLASNPSLSMLDEIRFLRTHRPDVPAEMILRMATANGEKALETQELSDEMSLAKRADLIAIPIDPMGATDPLENVLTSKLQPTHCIIGGLPINELT